MDPREEEELRQLIRRELENREKLRDDSGSRSHLDSAAMAEDRRRIIEDEIAAFYRAKGNHKRVVNEEGEIEWLTDEEMRERDSQIPVDMEELEEGQKRVRNRLVLFIFLGFCALVLAFLLMRERTGSVQVICNVPGCTILLDGSPTEFVTDHRMDFLTIGPHMISVTKSGFVPEGPASVRIDLKAGNNDVVILKLKPQGIDSLDRPR